MFGIGTCILTRSRLLTSARITRVGSSSSFVLRGIRTISRRGLLVALCKLGFGRARKLPTIFASGGEFIGIVRIRYSRILMSATRKAIGGGCPVLFRRMLNCPLSGTRRRNTLGRSRIFTAVSIRSRFRLGSGSRTLEPAPRAVTRFQWSTEAEGNWSVRGYPSLPPKRPVTNTYEPTEKGTKERKTKVRRVLS